VRIVRRQVFQHQFDIKLLSYDKDGRDGGEKYRYPARTEYAAARHGDNEQHAKAAVKPGARIHQQTENAYVKQHLAGGLQGIARFFSD
jgi:hypothetical protein